MPKLLFRGAVVAALALLIGSSSFAQADGAGASGMLKRMLKSLQVDEASRVAYLDEAAHPIAGEEFVKLVSAGAMFSIGKEQRQDAPPDVTFKLMSKEAVSAAKAPATRIKPGESFPPFRLTRLDGTPVDNKALEGKYTLINFYFAECAPCIKEVPELNAIAKKHTDLNFLALTFDSVADSKRFVAERGLTWPVVADARPLADAVGVKGYPTYALLDPKGRVVATSAGLRVADGRPVIEAWLEQNIGPRN
jgi:peroxiredoxin